MIFANSEIMIGGVLKDFINKYDGERMILTVHDSVVVHKEDVEELANSIRAHFKEKGLVPQLNIKRLTSGKLGLKD